MSHKQKGGPATLRPEITPPLKWHSPGGKQYLAKEIVALMPPRCKTPNAPAADDPGWLHYVEPYFGGGAVLLANDPLGISEVANDINVNLMNFWNCLSVPERFREFQRLVQSRPFSEPMFNNSMKDSLLTKERYHSRDCLVWELNEYAASFFVRCRQSLSGRMKGFAGITRNRTRKGMNEQVSAWLNCIDGLPTVHARLMRVLIRNVPALECIAKEDGPRTLFYLDPPYLHETRATTGEYAHEMTEQDHADLLNRLVSTRFSGGRLEGRFLLSGYRSELYDTYAERFGWRRHDFDAPNNAAGGKKKRRMTECVWTNY